MVRLIFAMPGREIPGYSQMGYYQGTGDDQGPLIITNFRPKSVMMKRTDSAGSGCKSNSTSRPFNDGIIENFIGIVIVQKQQVQTLMMELDIIVMVFN